MNQSSILERVSELLYRALSAKERRGQDARQKMAAIGRRRAIITQAYKLSTRVRDPKLRQKLYEILTYVHTDNIQRAISLTNTERGQNSNNNNNRYHYHR